VGRPEVNTAVDGYSSNTSHTSHLSRPLSSDGRWAFFNSPDALVPGDVNGRVDAYEYDFETGRVGLLSSGRASSDSYFLDASASGRDVFFVTRERLVGWDVDASYDLYDARVGGGFPEPVIPPAACQGDACKTGAAVPVAPGAVASSGFDGKGDVHQRLSRHARRKRCGHGKRRVFRRGKVRCVRRRAHRAHRAASLGVDGGVGR
jgi:hypothetical protein